MTVSDTVIAVDRDTTAEVAGCHAGESVMRDAAANAGKTAQLEQFDQDYPKGPHDQPHSMGPAFGSLRVGLRMRRTATVLSGSACCVYGLTFTSHFYGAKRTVGYVPFDSESLVTGKLFEDIREAVHELANPDEYDAVVVINLCVPTASGVPLDLLPDEINGVRIIGIDVPGFGVPTHAEAKDVLAGAMLRYARSEVQAGPVARPAGLETDTTLPSIAMVGEIFPVDAITIGRMLQPMGLKAGPVIPTREWRELYAALDCAAVAMLHPFYAATAREFKAAGRPLLGSAPVGVEGTRDWLAHLGDVMNLPKKRIDAAINAQLSAIRGVLQENPIDACITLSGYEGSELIVARLLIESGANVRYVGTACAKSDWSIHDCEWLESHGVSVKFRASLEDDLYAMNTFEPDIAIGTTPVVQRAKELSIPSLYFTNLISARPLMGVAGAGSLAQVINTAIAGRERFEAMESFFAGVGSGAKTGIWTPQIISRSGAGGPG
jgi:chlorophyllide a reductase subunit Y